MTLPVRSIRLEKRTAKSLDTLSGASGEIFFDADQNTLRIYTANQADSIVIADREWVEENTFSGDFQDLTNKPVIPTDIRDLSDIDNRLFSGNYSDLVGAPDVDSLSVDISTINSIGDVDTSTSPLVAGQLLEWDGTNWVNTTVAGFVNTDTTYSVAASVGDNGANITLTDSEGDTSQIELVGSNNITVGINIAGDIEIASSLPSLDQLGNTVITTPQDGQLLGYNSGQWINVAAPVAQGGIELTDLSVTSSAASGNGSLVYDNTLGVFTFTPPDLSSYATLSAFSVTTNTANAGGSLSYSNGIFTFRPALVSDFVALTDLSVVSNAPSGNGGLTYSNTTGQFTYTPADLSGAGSGEVVDDTTPTLGGALDAASNDITNVGTITATTYASAGTGAPSIVSASTIELEAPDGIILGTPSAGNIVLETILDGADTGSTKTGEWKVKLSGPYGNISGEIFEIGQTTQFGNTLTFDISTSLNTHGAVINYTDDLIIKAPTMTFDTALIGERVGTATDSGTVVTIDASSTSTTYDFLISGSRTLAFTNVPTTQDRIYTFSLFVAGTVTITGATVNGTSRNPTWEGGVNSTTGNTAEITIRILFAGGSSPIVLGNIREYS